MFVKNVTIMKQGSGHPTHMSMMSLHKRKLSDPNSRSGGVAREW